MMILAEVIQVPFGTWIVQLLDAVKEGLIVLILAMIGWLIAQAPAWLKSFFLSTEAEKIIKDAINSGIAVVESTVKDITWTPEISNEILKAAVGYIVTTASPAMVDYLGKEIPVLLQKLIAALKTEEPSAEIDVASAQQEVTTESVNKMLAHQFGNKMARRSMAKLA